MPARSGGVRSTPFQGGALLHDALRHEVHVLNPTAAVVWDLCDGVTPVPDVAATLAAATGSDPDGIERDVRAHLGELTAAGLVGRPILPPTVQVPAEERPDLPFRLRSLRVLDERVEVRSDDHALLADVRTTFGDLVDEQDVPPTAVVALTVTDAGARLRGRGHDEAFAGTSDLHEALASWLNRVVAPSSAVLAFHAGAVRAPDGQIVVIPGASGAGKSTVTAALVQAGWGYVTDEAAGIRPGTLEVVAYPKPIALDPRSRTLLGLPATDQALTSPGELRPSAAGGLGDSGALALVVLPELAPSAAIAISTLDAESALLSLAPTAINLDASGEDGLRTLAAIAQGVRCVRLRHRPGDLGATVAAIAATVGEPSG